MGPLITAYVFAIASLVAGAGVCSLAFGMRFVVKLAVGWFVVLTAAFFTNMLGLIAAVVIYVLSIKNQPPEAKVIYFVGLIPALPLNAFTIPFPGINYLWDLSFIRILVLSLFAPLYLQTLASPAASKMRVRSTDIYFFAYILLMALMTLRNGNVISAVRSLFSFMVDFGIPYYVVSRYIRNPQILHWVLCALLFSATFMCFASVIERWRVWRFMSEVFFRLGVEFDPSSLAPLSRDGKVRSAGGTMFIPLASAFFMALACVTSFYFWKQKLIRFFPAVILMTVCLMGLILTDSKGGMLALVAGVFVLYHTRLNPSFRFIVNVVVAVVVPSVFGYLVATEFKTIDTEGSFAYRYELVVNSLDVIADSPIFGSVNFTQHESLQRSIQGEGIVDIVNLYLQVILEYGFVGLFLYVMIFASLIKGVMKKPAVAEFDHKDIILALLVTIMVFIVTASNASFIPFYITLVWAIARAYIEFPEVQNQQPNQLNQS